MLKHSFFFFLVLLHKNASTVNPLHAYFFLLLPPAGLFFSQLAFFPLAGFKFKLKTPFQVLETLFLLWFHSVVSSLLVQATIMCNAVGLPEKQTTDNATTVAA